jgi:peroxiredoxin
VKSSNAIFTLQSIQICQLINSDMQFKFLKNINLLLTAIIFAVSISAFVGFIYLKKDNRLADEVKRLTDRHLPEANLLEIGTKKDFYNEVVKGDVILVYLISTCDACRNELNIIAESSIEQQVKIFGIMLENEDVVRRYVKKNNIEFPVLIDKNAGILDGLEIKYFPANLKLSNGVVKNVVLGTPENGQKFLEFIKN